LVVDMGYANGIRLASIRRFTAWKWVRRL